MESYTHRRQRDQQNGAVQLPFDLQRDALCDAAGDDGSARVPLLARRAKGLWSIQGQGPHCLNLCSIFTVVAEVIAPKIDDLEPKHQRRGSVLLAFITRFFEAQGAYGQIFLW